MVIEYYTDLILFVNNFLIFFLIILNTLNKRAFTARFFKINSFFYFVNILPNIFKLYIKNYGLFISRIFKNN